MFVTNFKQMLKTLPNNNNTDDAEEAHDIFMAHISDNELVVNPTDEFVTRVAKYSLKMIDAPPPTTSTLNPRIVLAALAMTRFPIETLRTLEQPTQLTLLNKAMNLLQSIDCILREHNPAEDDTADDFMPPTTAANFACALGEYRVAWAIWWQMECEEMKADVAAFEARMVEEDSRLSEEGPLLIFGDLEE